MDSRVRGNDEFLAKGSIGGSPVTPAERRCDISSSAMDSRIRGNDEFLVNGSIGLGPLHLRGMVHADTVGNGFPRSRE